MRNLVWVALEGAHLVNGKIVMITGASSGIGRACARMFAHQGGRLLLVDLDSDGLQQLCEEITGQGGEAFGIRGDVTQEQDVEKVFRFTNDVYGGLDVLINNAGGGRSTDFFVMELEEWKQIINLNLTSMFLVSKLAANILKEQGRGAIINISSQAGRSVGVTAGCHYTSSKAGVLGFTRDLAKVLAPYNVRVNAICPGLINSERIVQRLNSGGKMGEVEKSIPLRRIGDMDEVASCCIFLASDLSGYMTGATLDVNGGSLMI